MHVSSIGIGIFTTIPFHTPSMTYKMESHSDVTAHLQRSALVAKVVSLIHRSQYLTHHSMFNAPAKRVSSYGGTMHTYLWFVRDTRPLLALLVISQSLPDCGPSNNHRVESKTISGEAC